MISFNEIEKGVAIIMDGQPYEVLEAAKMFKGRGHSTLQVKLKNLISGSVVSRNFHASDSFKEAEISREKTKFLYTSKGQYFFCGLENPSQRFSLPAAQIVEEIKFLKANETVESLVFEGQPVSIILPVKVALKVVEAPPGVQGSRSQPGMKTVVLETGANINTPPFIEEGDVVEINTEKQEYVRRVD
ncbi:MAG: elongation factor P [bacterium]